LNIRYARTLIIYQRKGEAFAVEFISRYQRSAARAKLYSEQLLFRLLDERIVAIYIYISARENGMASSEKERV
jgi:hypothetical protein